MDCVFCEESNGQQGEYFVGRLLETRCLGDPQEYIVTSTSSLTA